MIRQWPLRLLLALGSGLTLALAFPLYRIPVLAWVSVGGLMVASLGVRPPRAWLYGFLHGAVFASATLPWIYTVMRVHGRLTMVPAASVLALLVAVWSLFPAAFTMIVAWLGQKSVARACVAAPFLLVALEYTRTHLPIIGFPWNLLGYAASRNLPLLQLASLTGIYGLSFLIAAYNALFPWVLHARSRRRHLPVTVLLVSTATLLLVVFFGDRLVPTEEPRHVAHLVQTDFPESPSYPADWMDRHAAEMDELDRLSITAGQKSPGLVVWPEVPAPFYLQDPKFAARAERIAREAKSHFLVGVVDWKPGVRGGLAPYNSAALLDPSGREVFLYDKIHLVPFGEYVPLRRWLTFAGKLTAEVGDFQSGHQYNVGELEDRERFGVFICYEAIFPAEVRHFVANGSNLLVNLSNDGWFGRSAAPAQHLEMARVRAVENRRWLLRCTNNGYTVVVDPYGRYAARLAPDLRGVLDAPYDFRSDLTPYARWGDWLAWLCVAVVIAGLVQNARMGQKR